MKMILSLPKTTGFLLFIFLISVSISCKNDKKIETDKSYGGSSKRDDICQLISKDDIQSVFALSDEIDVEQSESASAICSYGWEALGEKYMYYKVSLNFARGKKRTNSQIDAIWESQNEDLYSRHNLQKVSGVGDKASWSKLGGGQLRVAADGHIFYVSLSVTPGEDNPMETQEMIEKTSTLAKIVIDKI